MSARQSGLIEFSKIKTRFPVVALPWDAALGGHPEQGFIMVASDKVFAACPSLKLAHQLLLQSDPVGRVGNYRAVFEIAVGVEAYTPDTGSDPGPGVVGVEELMRCIIFTTYADSRLATNKQITNFIHSLADLHPWEHPLIEWTAKGSTKIYGRAKRKSLAR